ASDAVRSRSPDEAWIVPSLSNGTLITVPPEPVPAVFLKVPLARLWNSWPPTSLNMVPSALMSHVPALLMKFDVQHRSSMLPAVQVVVRLLVRVRPLSRKTLEDGALMLSVAPAAMTVVPASDMTAPPVQVIAPVTLKVPVPPMVPLLKVRL